MTSLQEIGLRMDKEEKSFLEVDQTLRELRGGEPSQLPPIGPAMGEFESNASTDRPQICSVKSPGY